MSLDTSIDNLPGPMYDFQRGLSKAQAVPVVGPILISPIKAVVSIAEMVAGIAGLILFGTPACLCFNSKLTELAFHSVKHVSIGAISFAYSIGNICTLGVLGYKIEAIDLGCKSNPA